MILFNPRVVVAIGTEVLLGFTLGYIMAKMAKYVLAFIALLTVRCSSKHTESWWKHRRPPIRAQEINTTNSIN